MYAVMIKGIPGQSVLTYGPFKYSSEAAIFAKNHPAPATVIVLIDPSA